MSRTVLILALLLVIRCTDLPCQGMSPDSAPERPTRRWSIVFGSFAHTGGPTTDFERAMVSAGLDENSVCWLFCTGTVAHPFSRRGGLGNRVTLGYAYRPRLGARLSWHILSFGETLGYRDPLMYLFLRGTTHSFALVAYFTPEGVLRLGAGPSIDFLRVARTDAPSMGKDGTRTAKLGLALDIGISIPRNTKFFFDCGAQYRLVGSAQVGPFVENSFDGSTSTTLDSRASFNHGVFSMGIGMRW